jgi:hypothetical protein
MSRFKLYAIAAAFLMLPTMVQADPPKEKKKEVKVKVEEKSKSERGGSGFKNFWIHTVGGSIGNGLKSGAKKISNTFD